MEIFDTNPSVYTSQDNGKTYVVESGNEFSVLCFSTGEFSGRVTWIKEENEGNAQY